MWARPYTVGPHTYMVIRFSSAGSNGNFLRAIVS
jgi:hypothetical protein